MLPTYTPKYIFTAGTVSVQPAGNCYLHTINCPIALTGIATFKDVSGTTYFVLPVGSIGSLKFDCVLTDGLQVTTTLDDKLIVTSKQG